MVRAGPIAAASVFASLLLSGCSGLDLLDGGDGPDGALVRIVEVDLSSFGIYGLAGANDAEDVLSLARTRFEYTHGGDAVDPDDVTVSYRDEDGREREAPLSRFTSLDEVGRGDRVTIEDVLLTSQVEVRKGGEVLASRGRAPSDWLEVSGYPLPFAAEPGARAEWTMRGDARLDASFDHAQVVERGTDDDYSCEPVYGDDGQVVDMDCRSTSTPYTETTRVDGFRANAASDLDGVLSIAEVGTGAQPRLEVGLDGVAQLSAFLDARVRHDRTGAAPEHEDASFGFDVEAEADGDGLARFTFSPGSQLRAVGGEGRLLVTADITAWDAEHPRSSDWHPASIPDPLLDVSAPYTEETVDGDDPVAFVAEALADLWRMDLAAGDEFRLESGAPGPYTPSGAILVRVVAEEEKTVPAGTFDTLRIETTASLKIDTPDGDQSFGFPPTSLWIDEESGVPVAFEQVLDLRYGRADLEALFALAESLGGGDVDFDSPDELTIAATGSSAIELTEWEEGLRMAPMATVLSPFMGLALPLAGMFMAPLGALGGFGYGEDSYAESAPDISFVKDTAERTLTVVMVESGVDWYDLDVQGTASCSPPSGGPVQAGDQISCLGAGEVRIAHLPTNTLLYVGTF